MNIYTLTKEETFYEDGEVLETIFTPISYHKTEEGALAAAKKIAPENSQNLLWIDEDDNCDIRLTIREVELQD